MRKTYLTKTVFIINIFCILCFSKVATAFFNQQVQQQLFSMFHQEQMCKSLVGSHITNNFEIKPVAQASLPLEYYIHESIPKGHRPFIYDQAEAWNNTAGNEIVRINSEIDRGVFNRRVNSSDQKNVIYLIDASNDPNNNITTNADTVVPGASGVITSKAEFDLNTSSFIPITDSDIMIGEGTLTDIGFYRNLLLVDMKSLGIEGDFNDKSTETIRRAISSHIINMTDEDVKALSIKLLEVEKERLEASRNTGSTHDTIFDALNEMDQRIEGIQNMSTREARQFKNNISRTLLFVDMDLMESQSSVIFQTIVKRKIGDGLGLMGYVLPDNHPMRHSNIMRPHYVEDYGQITTHKEIDPFAILGVFCLYKDYPTITNYDVLHAAISYINR